MGLLRRFGNLLRERRLAADFDDEIAFHLAMSEERRVAQGVPRAAARREALLRFGNRSSIRERTREMDTLGFIDRLVQDVRYGLRVLLKNPAFSGVAVAALALGLGANTALWTVVHSVLLRPLPYVQPERLMFLEETFLPAGWGSASAANFRDWREQNRTFAQLALYAERSGNLQGGAAPERIPSVLATANLFATLRVPPLLGRTFATDADQPAAPLVVVLSEGLWRRRFGADPKLIGRAIRLDDEWPTVIGVMPARFQFPVGYATDAWLPLRLTSEQRENRGAHLFSVVGRLRPGVGLAAAQDDLRAVARRYVALKLDDEGRSVRVLPLRESVVRQARPLLLTLTGAVAFVLLIACSNVANLQLARAAHRKREVAVRAALGAGRWRLVRQFLIESLLLALAGGATGLLLARAGVRLLAILAAGELPRAGELALDLPVLGLLFVACLATALAFGLAPARAIARVDPKEGLGEGAGRGTLGAGPGQRRLRAALVVAELTLALVLLIGAGLMARTLWALQSTHPGFDARHVLTLHLAAPARKYADRQVGTALFRPVLERVRALPEVRGAAWIDALPLASYGVNGDFTVEGRPPSRAGEKPYAGMRIVSPGYFAALGIPLRSGRDIDDRDDARAPRTTVINRELARRFFPGEDPIGHRMGWPEIDFMFTIVGVVDDVRESQLSRPPQPLWYFSYQQAKNEWLPEMTLVVRGAGDPQALAVPVQGAVQRVDPLQPVYEVKTMEQVVGESIASSRLRLTLLALFAALALALAAGGIYGVTAYLVAQRTPELGMRAALGARPREVFQAVLQQALPQIGLGVALGLASAFALTRLVRSWLFGVSPLDPATFAGVTALLVAVALIAVYLPARRAADVDPMIALRAE